MTEEIKEKALGAFMKTPYWKGVYEKAPDKVKRIYELSFARAEKLITEEDDKEGTMALYRQFEDADWEYLIENTQNSMAKWGYQKARERFGGKEQGEKE